MVKCIDCFEDDCHKTGQLKGGQRWECHSCGRHFTEGSTRSYSIHYKRMLVGKILIDGMTYRKAMYKYRVSSATLVNRVKLFKRGVI